MFLRALAPIVPNPFRMVEWNIPSLSQLGSTFWFSDPLRPSTHASGLRRHEYHDLRNISGISAVVRHARTVGLFCHHRDCSPASFKSFAMRMETIFCGSTLIFLYFPINGQEEIRGVGVRWIQNFLFPVNCPVIQVRSFSL